MLENPKLATKQATWPTIKCKKVPFKPYTTFQERLIAELLAPNPVPHKGRDISDDMKLSRETG